MMLAKAAMFLAALAAAPGVAADVSDDPVLHMAT
jgi:hypothetical protein